MKRAYKTLKMDSNNQEMFINRGASRFAMIISLVVLFLCCTIGFEFLFGVRGIIDISDRVTLLDKDLSSGLAATYEISFPDIENLEQYDLKFSTRGCVVELISGNEVVYTYGAAQSADKRYIGRVYSSVPLTEVNTDIPAELHATVSDRGSDPAIIEVELCPHSETERYYLTNGSASFPLALFSFSLVFLIMLFTGIGGNRAMARTGIFLSGSLACFSIILLDGSGHYLMFTSNMDRWNIAFWLSAYLFPFFVIMFFREAEKSVKQKWTLLIIALLNLAFFVAASILGLRNIIPLYYLTRTYHFLLIIDAVFGIIHIIRNIKKNQSIVNLRALLVTTLIWVLVELLNYFYPRLFTVYLALPIFDYRSISAILLFYAFCVTYSAITYEESRNRLLQHQQISILEQRERQLTPYQEMAVAFFENYECIYYIDTETSEFVCYYQSDEYERLEIEKSGKDFFEAASRNCDGVVYEEDVDYVKKMLSKEAVLDGVRDGKRYSFVYRIVLNGQPTYYQIHGKMEQSERHIMVGVRDINDIVKQEEALLDASRQLQEAKEELRLSRVKNFNSQMQPHFLYNVLSSIQEIICDDPDYASQLIGSFTVHLRGTIQAISSDNPIEFNKELKNIKAYVEIEKMRLTDRLTVKYDIRASEFMVAPLSIQPLVENAIKHGIYKMGEEGGTLFLRSFETENSWIVQVMDDGVGFDYKQIMRDVEEGKRDSTGLQNLKFRLEKLMGAALQINSKPGEGTIVTVIIPKGKGVGLCVQS